MVPQDDRELKMNIKANTTPLRIAGLASLIMLSTLFPGNADIADPIAQAPFSIQP